MRIGYASREGLVRRRILFIDYVDSGKQESGSSVRPAMMQKQMRSMGHAVLALEGNQVASNRPSKIKEFKACIKSFAPDYCYIESPTYPILRHADRALIKYIHKLGIPIGYFYRDFYRMFPEQFPRRRDPLGRVKDFGLDALQAATDRVLRYCDIVYFPSWEAARLFQYSDKRVLPPAGVDKTNGHPAGKRANKVGIYVGGISGPYSIRPLLDAYAALHAADSGYRLILVCREPEWDAFNTPHKGAPWLEVHHGSGDRLDEYYYEASVAYVMPDPGKDYNNLAVSVKVFNYMSYGLPLIAAKVKAMSEFVETEGVGVCVNADAASIAEATVAMLEDEGAYQRFSQRVRDSLVGGNLWEHRARRVESDLLNI